MVTGFVRVGVEWGAGGEVVAASLLGALVSLCLLLTRLRLRPDPQPRSEKAGNLAGTEPWS